MIAVAAGAVGLALSALVWPAMRTVFAAPVLLRQNYRGHELPVGSGIVIMIAVLIVAAGAAAADRFDVIDQPGLVLSLGSAAVLTVGTAMLGFVDDITGTTDRRGFRGHLRALVHGEVTSGLVKLLGTPAVAVLALTSVTTTATELIVGTVIVALAANVGNLFDRAPGRTIKVTLVAAVPLALGGMAVAVAGPLVVIGAGVGLLAVDLREDAMLGDTGANALGAGLGALMVIRLESAGQLAALVVLLALNVASEFVSFSRVIDRLAPLRRADRWGRRAG